MEPVSQKGSFFWPLLRFNFENIAHRVLRMSSWILTLFQMLLPKFRRK
jgi:hypothetical protein